MGVEILGVRTGVTCSDGINKAYVLNDEDLRRFFKDGKEWVEKGMGADAEPVIQCKALMKNAKESLESEDINKILDQSNPKKSQIYDICLKMAAKKNERTFQINFQSIEYPNLIQLVVGGLKVPETEMLFHRLFAELNDATQWYWLLSCRRWLLKVSKWLIWSFLILLVIFSAFSFMGSRYRNYRARKIYEEYAKKHIAAEKDIRSNESEVKKESTEIKPKEIKQKEVSPVEEVWKLISNSQFLAGVGIGLGIIFLERLSIYLFPKAIFEIGKGKERHKRLKGIRKWVGGILTTIILFAFIIPIIIKYIHGTG